MEGLPPYQVAQKARRRGVVTADIERGFPWHAASTNRRLWAAYMRRKMAFNAGRQIILWDAIIAPLQLNVTRTERTSHALSCVVCSRQEEQKLLVRENLFKRLILITHLKLWAVSSKKFARKFFRRRIMPFVRQKHVSRPPIGARPHVQIWHTPKRLKKPLAI